MWKVDIGGVKNCGKWKLGGADPPPPPPNIVAFTVI